MLEEQNKHHRTTSSIADQLMSLIDMDRVGEPGVPARTPTELLIEVGYAQPTNPQMKECAGFLREHCGQSKRINGQNKWRAPLKGEKASRSGEEDQDPGYDKFD